MAALFNPICTACTDKLSSGETLFIDDNTVITNKHLTFTCDIDDIGEGKIILGHGKTEYSASYIEISKNLLEVFNTSVGTVKSLSVEHGLEISGFLKAKIDVFYGKATVTLLTKSGSFRKEDINFAGRNGKVFAQSEGVSLASVKANWTSNGYNTPVYFFGDSYFNPIATARWPSYMIKDGYTNNLLVGYPGMSSKRGIIDFRKSLERGNPKFVVWCLGMNDSDNPDSVNPDWLKNTKEVISTCKERNITPILSTTPTVKSRPNIFKNDFVRQSNCRYIDFNHAVGGDKDPLWYDGMINTNDFVHPETMGAKALYMQALCDFPELML